jgi:hypothetical protein
MKHNLFAAAIALSAACAPLAAAPIQKSHVPAEPAWVVHVDLDRLRPTAIGQYLLGEMQKPEAQSKLAAFQAIFNFDPRQQLFGLTFYGITPAQEDGVLLLYADVDPNRLETLAKAAKDHQSTPYGQYVIHNWIDDKKPAKNGVQPRTYAAVFGSKVVVFGQKESIVARSLDVLSGKVQSLGSTSLWPHATDAASGFIQGFARKFEVSESDPNSALLKLANSLSFHLAEAQGNVTGALNMNTRSEEVASSMASIAKGLISLTRLQPAKPEAARFAEALNLTQDADKVVIQFSMPSSDVVAMMKADAERKAQAAQK